MGKPQLLEDEIGRKLAEAERSGELRAARNYGKPFTQDAGWEQTPDELRMPFKILKDAGFAPPEVALFHERAALRHSLDQARTDAERRRLQRELAELEQKIALRLEGLGRSGAL
jgi:hypothetical protein